MRKLTIFCLLLYIVCAGCKDRQQEPVTPIPPVVVDHQEDEPGIPTLEELADLANRQALKTALPNAAMQKETLLVNEGMTNIVSIRLNPSTKDEVRIDFKPGDTTTVWRVSVAGRENKFQSRTGVHPGMTVEELNKLNMIPVDFFGFGWDFSGAVAFNKGALEQSDLFVYLATDKDFGIEFTGDSPHSSENEEAKKLELYVDKIMYVASKIEYH